MVLVRVLPVLLTSCLVACGGAKAKAKVSAQSHAQAEVNFDQEPLTEGSENPSQGDSDPAVRASAREVRAGVKFGPPALLGARHDVRLNEPAKKVSCRCLAAVSGSSAMDGLTWSDLPPELDESRQVLVVLESEGVPCDDAKAPGASYMGYHKEGADIVIDIEAAHPGRPVTRGAVVPLPDAGGRILISAPGQLPYGGALQGGGRCAL